MPATLKEPPEDWLVGVDLPLGVGLADWWSVGVWEFNSPASMFRPRPRSRPRPRNRAFRGVSFRKFEDDVVRSVLSGSGCNPYRSTLRKSVARTIRMSRNAFSTSRSLSPVTMYCAFPSMAHSSTMLSSGSRGTASNSLGMLTIRERFDGLLRRKAQLQFQFLGQFLHQLRAGHRLNFTGPRPLDTLEWISPPGGRGEKNVRIENGSNGHGYLSCSKASTKASRASSDMRSQSSPRSADIRRSWASPNPIRSSRRACASCARASKAVRLRTAGNCRTMEITCSSFNSNTLMHIKLTLQSGEHNESVGANQLAIDSHCDKISSAGSVADGIGAHC